MFTMGFGVLNVISERSERMRRRGKGGKSSGRTIIDLIKRFKWGLSCRKSASAKAWSRFLSLTPAASITHRLRGKSSLHVREKARNDVGSPREWPMTLSMTSQGRCGDCMIVGYKGPKERQTPK